MIIKIDLIIFSG